MSSKKSQVSAHSGASNLAFFFTYDATSQPNELFANDPILIVPRKGSFVIDLNIENANDRTRLDKWTMQFQNLPNPIEGHQSDYFINLPLPNNPFGTHFTSEKLTIAADAAIAGYGYHLIVTLTIGGVTSSTRSEDPIIEVTDG